MSCYHQVRRQAYPRAAFPAREPTGTVRPSDVILGLTLLTLVVVLLAYALTHLFAT